MIKKYCVFIRDGRIKLLGKDNTQALLQSTEPTPSKFLQFVDNQGVLLNVTTKNNIEVWDIEMKELVHVHVFKGEITSFTVIRHSFYMYVGDSLGNISVFKLDQETYHLVQMNYNIPLSASHGNTTEVADDTAVMCIMPQPMAESKRILILFKDGLIILWGSEESKVIYITGGNALHSLSNDARKVACACWACPFGSKVVVGYSNGEIYIWSIPPLPNLKRSLANEKEELPASQNIPICKLNLGYKMDKSPIISLKWVYGDEKSSRLYVNGSPGTILSNSFQIILLNEHMEARIIKLTLPLLEPCLDMEIISGSSDLSKQRKDLIMVLKSGQLCTYDDSVIEKYLLQSQSKSPPSLPKAVMIKLPFTESSITIAKFVTNDSSLLSGLDEDYNLLAKNFPPVLPLETISKDGSHSNIAQFTGFSKIKNLYITGHSDGTINFWDVTYPLLLPISSMKQQSEEDHSINGNPVTALYFDITSRLLVTGNQAGMVRIFKFKSEPFPAENNFFSRQGSTKKGSTHFIHSVKLVKVNGAVLSINLNRDCKHFAVGSDQGYVSVIDMEGPTVLFQKQITSELCTGVMSLQFETCNYHGFEKKVLVVATKDSSIMTLESDTGSILGVSAVHPKKLSRAIFVQSLDIADSLDVSKGNFVEDSMPKQSLILLCNEKSVYLYSLIHAVQGIKKVQYKKKFHDTSCCWASTFYNHDSSVALILLFTNGKLQIRSLPELSLLKETSIRGFSFTNSYSAGSISSSSEGELIMVNGDQEVFFFSVFLRKEIYRLLNPSSQVYRKGVIEQGPISGITNHKEKKKGLFSSVMKGNKAKCELRSDFEDSKTSIEDELSAIFSTENFPLDIGSRNHQVDEDDAELDIDDIDIEDPGEKPKGSYVMGSNMIAVLNKQKLTNKFLAIKGKIKQKMVKNEKAPGKVDSKEDQDSGTVDQIKKKYGFSMSAEPNAAKIYENKLRENVKKLQGVNLRTTEMQDTARSFSALAKEVLRTAEQDKRSS
ncbi:hypothetical protein GIB67_026817 [Kingdonia uniflora]|uniref:Lethal giant larvae (Lgl)-like C-terminal domain-containing protein n=1 Tax=Kingdonia uniflora TaxID=39325 RepID=A0A7J7MHP0_9MAGN|nr:hypothetical protein GIB67_026817 [Kingdonia uniflora]